MFSATSPNTRAKARQDIRTVKEEDANIMMMMRRESGNDFIVVRGLQFEIMRGGGTTSLIPIMLRPKSNGKNLFLTLLAHSPLNHLKLIEIKRRQWILLDRLLLIMSWAISRAVLSQVAVPGGDMNEASTCVTS